MTQAGTARVNDLDLTKRVEFIENHLNGNFHSLSPGFPIPLNIPFHINKPEHNDLSYIRFIEILDKQNLKISYKKYDKNHLVEKYDSSSLNNKFISILFNQKLDNQFIEKILLNGIFINSQQYNFIGYSNSQLQGRSCYLYNDTNDQIE